MSETPNVAGGGEAWKHCRWIEPHVAIPKPGSIGPVRAQGGRVGAACEACNEAIVPASLLPPGSGADQ